MGKGDWKKLGNLCSVQVLLSYRPLHVQKWRHLAPSEGGVFSPLMPRTLDTRACPVGGSEVLSSLNQFS